MNSPGRDPRLDALRGLALLGILLVNIESFLCGGPNPLGYLEPDAGLADKAAYFDPMADKVYRHPTFYELPKSLDHM